MTIKNVKYIFLFITIFVVTLGALAQSVAAASLDVTSRERNLFIGQRLEVRLLLDSKDENINAFQGILFYPQELLQPDSIREANSITSFWIKKPQVKMQNSGRIEFAGLIPGGFNSENGLLFSVIFTTKKSGSGSVTVNNFGAFRNDSRGSRASLTSTGYNFSVQNQRRVEGAEDSNLLLQDTDPPESFSVQTGKHPSIFDNQWFVAFAAQDKVSGVSHYEILETNKKLKEQELSEEWPEASSPYLLQDQSLRSFVYVKAADREGNERVEIIKPASDKWYKNYLFYVIVLLIAALGFTFRRFYKK